MTDQIITKGYMASSAKTTPVKCVNLMRSIITAFNIISLLNITNQHVELSHCPEAVGMFFFEDNNYVLIEGNPIVERLAKVAQEQNILLMGCDQCCWEREIDGKLVEGAIIGCFSNRYDELAGNMPDQVITL